MRNDSMVGSGHLEVEVSLSSTGIHDLDVSFPLHGVLGSLDPLGRFGVQ